MSKLKKAVLVVLVLIGLGTIAEIYNKYNHHRMAIEECGSEDNIKRVDSKGYECIKN